MTQELPIPPLPMREALGPTDPGEVARALAPGGVFYSTWFPFDKRDFRVESVQLPADEAPVDVGGRRAAAAEPDPGR